MGNPVSPVLSGIEVSFTEHIWRSTHEQWLQSNRLTTCLVRYVDKRLLLGTKSCVQESAIRTLQHHSFYIPPVLLEEVENPKEFLGFLVDPVQRSILYKFPSQAWEFRSPRSAGSNTLLFSGFRSRVFLITKFVFPTAHRDEQLRRLIELYVSFGFHKPTLEDLAFR